MAIATPDASGEKTFDIIVTVDHMTVVALLLAFAIAAVIFAYVRSRKRRVVGK